MVLILCARCLGSAETITVSGPPWQGWGQLVPAASIPEPGLPTLILFSQAPPVENGPCQERDVREHFPGELSFC